MKKTYTKPEITIETYMLNDSIAACETVIAFGPRGESSECGDFGFGGEVAPFSVRSYNPFYEDNCYCYYTAPEGSGYFGKS